MPVTSLCYRSHTYAWQGEQRTEHEGNHIQTLPSSEIPRCVTLVHMHSPCVNVVTSEWMNRVIRHFTRPAARTMATRRYGLSELSGRQRSTNGLAVGGSQSTLPVEIRYSSTAPLVDTVRALVPSNATNSMSRNPIRVERFQKEKPPRASSSTSKRKLVVMPRSHMTEQYNMTTWRWTVSPEADNRVLCCSRWFVGSDLEERGKLGAAI